MPRTVSEIQIFCTKTHFYLTNSSNIFYFSDALAPQQVENQNPVQNELNPALAEGRNLPNQNAANGDQIEGTFI